MVTRGSVWICVCVGLAWLLACAGEAEKDAPRAAGEETAAAVQDITADTAAAPESAAATFAQFQQAVRDRDAQVLYDLLSSRVIEAQHMTLEMMEQALKDPKVLAQWDPIAAAEVQEVEVEGDTAAVLSRNADGTSRPSFEIVREEGQWRIKGQ